MTDFKFNNKSPPQWVCSFGLSACGKLTVAEGFMLKEELVLPALKWDFRFWISAPVYFIAMCTRVFHKNPFIKEKFVHTLTTPYRAYINHTQKISFLGQVIKVPPLSLKWGTFTM